jgi:hypothetical protein
MLDARLRGDALRLRWVREFAESERSFSIWLAIGGAKVRLLGAAESGR